VVALNPAPGVAAYAAAKGGLTVLTRALALEFGPRVRVNQVTAGLVQTEKADDYYGGADGQRAVAALIRPRGWPCRRHRGRVPAARLAARRIRHRRRAARRRRRRDPGPVRGRRTRGLASNGEDKPDAG